MHRYKSQKTKLLQNESYQSIRYTSKTYFRPYNNPQPARHGPKKAQNNPKITQNQKVRKQKIVQNESYQSLLE